MKFRTNRERLERKLKKATTLKESKKGKSYHASSHFRPGYSTIIQMVREKTSLITIRHAHAARGIEKQVLFPRLLWNNGTYVRKIHGEFKPRKGA